MGLFRIEITSASSWNYRPDQGKDIILWLDKIEWDNWNDADKNKETKILDTLW